MIDQLLMESPTQVLINSRSHLLAINDIGKYNVSKDVLTLFAPWEYQDTNQPGEERKEVENLD